MRIAAALNEGEVKILLADYFTPASRMMIRRRVRDRLQNLAGFLEWDADPYLVVTGAGRLCGSWTGTPPPMRIPIRARSNLPICRG